jgi:predicted DsbA family dithiol-disulfide isomerase
VLAGTLAAVLVEIWSDVVCPWCYIGKRRFEAALARFEHRDEVTVLWRSYELDPSLPPGKTVDLLAGLAAKYGVTREQAEAMNERVSRIAEDEGLHYRLDIAKRGNTFDAHRLIHLGAQEGVQDAVKESLMAAYQCEGQPIAEPDALVAAAVRGGLDEDDARGVVESDAFAMAVRVDEEEGRMLGISGVPFFAIDRRYGVAGAQSPDVMLDALEQAWATRPAPA